MTYGNSPVDKPMCNLRFRGYSDLSELVYSMVTRRAPKFIKTVADGQVLDVGCGGGILADAMARCGAQVTGIDLASKALRVAQLHAMEAQTPNVQYQEVSVEALAQQQPQSFDVVTCMEMLEHVPEPLSILRAAASLLKPQGKLFVSTINRNLKSYLMAIVGAEYILRLLPRGTHEYAKFIRPSELRQWAYEVGFQLQKIKGMNYQPFTQEFSLTDDVAVNYLVYFEKC